MQALSWALGLRDLEPTVKLLTIYLCNGLLTARYRDVDVDMAADFCGVTPGTILKLAKQLPKKISFTHEKGSGRIRFDMGQVVEGSQPPTMRFVMPKNANASPLSKQSRRAIRTVEAVEALLAIERMENEADYRMRGRCLESLTDAALEQRWIKCLRRVLNADRLRRTEMDDISAELSLRGISNVKLPPNLLELVTADVRKLIRREREVSGQEFN